MNSTDNKRRLTLADLCETLRVSRQTIHRWRRAGNFPKPIAIGQTVRWRASDVERWEREREARR